MIWSPAFIKAVFVYRFARAPEKAPLINVTSRLKSLCDTHVVNFAGMVLAKFCWDFIIVRTRLRLDISIAGCMTSEVSELRII